MVTAVDPQEPEESVESIEPVVEGDEGQPEEVAVPEPGPPGEAQAATGGATVEAPTTGAPQAPPQAPPQVDQAAITELQQRRAAEQERGWREKVGRAARAYENQLQNAGYMPEQARDQAKRYVQQEQKFRKQDEEAAGMIGHIQGRQLAAAHFMKKHGLAPQQVLDDLIALQSTTSPAEMEKEAVRMKNDRALRTEMAQLKQGRVPVQTFDNSQGSSGATANDQRLLDQYISGDRSDAAVQAARRITSGN